MLQILSICQTVLILVLSFALAIKGRRKNTGDDNSGWGNLGDFNTDTPKLRMFNKETDVKREDIDYPNFFFQVYPIKWIYSEDMTEEEKKENPEHKTTGGYLKTIPYKEAWKKVWDEAEEEDRKKVFKLPNFDAEIFFEITGIDLRGNDKC